MGTSHSSVRLPRVSPPRAIGILGMVSRSLPNLPSQASASRHARASEIPVRASADAATAPATKRTLR